MPSRNEPCPCGDATKYRRYCLLGLEAVSDELRDRDFGRYARGVLHRCEAALDRDGRW